MPLTDYQEEYLRVESALLALGKTLSSEEIKKMVIDDLTGIILLSLEAKQNGFQLSDPDIDLQMDQINSKLGGDQELNIWLQNNHFSLESFRRSIVRNAAAAWQRDKIRESVGNTADQIHARQILFTLESSANNYRQRVDNGSDFSELAAEADPVTKGDLGWFPKGYLLQPEVEETVFSLQVGEVSPVIKSEIGFHLIQVIERDPQRQLSAEARIALQNEALEEWVNQAKSGASIEILIP
ncbi:MAG: hypothetical protein GX577_15470 [Leptolinea sp.]|nr:hypothetical protein [Leptolinea sp.]